MPDYTSLERMGGPTYMNWTDDNIEAGPIDYTALPPLTDEDYRRIKDTLHEIRCKRPGMDTIRVLNLQSWLCDTYAARLVAELERLRAEGAGGGG